MSSPRSMLIKVSCVYSPVKTTVRKVVFASVSCSMSPTQPSISSLLSAGNPHEQWASTRKSPHPVCRTIVSGVMKQEHTEVVISLTGLEELVGALRRRGYRVVGPKLRDGAIVYDELDSAAELPVGWTDVQEPGSYRV